ncbi:hypothetical protein [Pseudonocardia aurantiaca]|uniref:Uncharacterized protein n=1 Tax=Pseudonocardia aurantiaca TaxID=75290 RepID=A0ABW4FNK5_9PSEU
MSHSELPTDPAVAGLVLGAVSTGPLGAGGECGALRAVGAG